MAKAKPQYPRVEPRRVGDVRVEVPCAVRRSAAVDVYQLKKQVERLGVLRPPVLNVRTGRVVDGERLVAVLREADPDAEVQFWCVDLSEGDEELARLALNNHCGVWQWQEVSAVLKAAGADVAATGFKDYYTRPLLASDWTVPAKGALDGGEPAQGSFF